MGVYLNSKKGYTLYASEVQQPYFVDKSKMLQELFPLVSSGNKHICITRPRRFGKTVMANMIDAFFSAACDSSELFRHLQISHVKEYEAYLNKYQVIHISFHEMDSSCNSYEQYIQRIEKRLIRDLKKAYPDVELFEDESAADVLLDIYAEDENARFIFVLDEWDYIFHQNFVREEHKKAYLTFLKNLLKDQPYVRLAYMTGILPIAKYSSGSELNMFAEYTMATEEKFSEYFGFTDKEVDMLYERYCKAEKNTHVTREGLQEWYDGYHTKMGERVYNPRSVVVALTNNNLGNYWTNSGPYDEIYYYIENNVDAVRDDLALMVSGQAVQTKIQEYAATASRLQTKEEIFSAMVVYGFLSYEDGKVFIPNKELMLKFSEMLQREPSLGYVYNLAKESERMLQATLRGDTTTMEEILAYAHNTEVPILSYNNETELSAIVNLVYLSARDRYRVEREDKAGIGFVDFIFYPENKNDDALILELKVDKTAEEAVQQIKDKQYVLRLKGKLGEKAEYKGDILLVGISYDRKTKEHQCLVERCQSIK